MAEPYKVYQRNLNIPDAKENFFVMQKLAFRNFTNGLLANASRIQDLCKKETHKSLVVVTFWYKYRRFFQFKFRRNSKTFCKIDKHFETLILYLFIALSSDLKYDHEI